MTALLDRLAGALDALFALPSRYPAAIAHRVVGALLALPSVAVLGIARWLTPNPQGFGTHTQLGLGECVMMSFTGWPCPMCGMTTTFTLLAHLRPLDAFLTQPFGVVLFSLTVLAAVVGTVDLLAGVGLYRRVAALAGRREQTLALGFLGGMLLGWFYKALALHLGPFGP